MIIIKTLITLQSMWNQLKILIYNDYISNLTKESHSKWTDDIKKGMGATLFNEHARKIDFHSSFK